MFLKIILYHFNQTIATFYMWGFCAVKVDRGTIVPFKLNLKAWQFTIWNYFRVVKSYFKETFLAQYNAILNFPISALCYGYAGDRIGFSQANILTTFSTPSSPSIFPVLSIASYKNDSRTKVHNNAHQYHYIRNQCKWNRTYVRVLFGGGWIVGQFGFVQF